MFEFSDLPKEIQALILSKLCKTSLLDAHKFFIEFGLYYRNLLLTYSPDKSDPWLSWKVAGNSDRLEALIKGL